MDGLNTKKKPLFDLAALNLPSLPDAVADEDLSAMQSGEKFIVFILDSELFAISSKRVAEVTQPLTVTPLPNIPEQMLGIANLRGEIISVANLQKLLGKNYISTAPKARFIILRSPNSPTSTAFTVDKVGEFITLSDHEIKQTDQLDSPFIFGKTAYKSNFLQLVDLEKILTSLDM